MTLVIAHQGASLRHPGNTVEAFVEAGRMGADMVELDVHLTADGALAVHHDADIANVGLISRLSVAELPDWVPLLDDAMTACEGMDVNIEAKAPIEAAAAGDLGGVDALAQAVAAFVTERGLESRVLVSCFWLPLIDAVRAVNPAIPTAWLTSTGWDHVRAVGDAAVRGHSALHPNHQGLTREVIDAAHAAGLTVNTWTCDEPDHMREMAAWGIDGICTNAPDVAIEVLRGT